MHLYCNPFYLVVNLIPDDHLLHSLPDRDEVMITALICIAIRQKGILCGQKAAQVLDDPKWCREGHTKAWEAL